MKIEKLKVNHITNPMGYAFEKPVLSYVVTESTGQKQEAARIRVAADAAMEQVIYDSGLREDISSLAFSPDIPLRPRTRYFWNVEVLAEDGDRGVSETAFFETGKREEPWQGRWIRAPFEGHPILYKDFSAGKPVASARLYICGLGVYEAYLNGEKIGDTFLAPFFTSYHRHIQYQTYDVTEQLRGENRLSVMLGRGWYHGRFGFGDPQDKIYGKHMQLIAELHIVYAAVIPTDESWSSVPSPVIESNIYDGEVWDARLVPWNGKSTGVLPAEVPDGLLRERLSPDVVKHEVFRAYTLLHTPAGELVLDFGQVITGWVEFDAAISAGTAVNLEYGELLQNNCFYNENLRTAKAAYTYLSDGLRHHVRPHFTFYGFRYVRVQGMTEEEIRNAGFTAYAIYSDLEQTGSLQTSNEKVNRLISNAVWSRKDNFLDVPTDCPQRDERMGWTGDAQVFASTASFNMDKKILAFSDKADGVEDGLVSDLSYARSHREDIRNILAGELSEKQLAFLDCISTPLEVPFGFEHGTSTMNEISVYEGASVYEVVNGMPILNIYGSAPGAADTMSVAGANGILRNMILRDPDFDVENMDYAQIREELCRASKLFDVAPHSLDDFKKKGGKVILAQGTEDMLVSPYVTIQFYERLCEHYGDTLGDMLRFYLIPGYGHGFGGSYGMHVDFVSALDGWVNENRAPAGLVSVDCMDMANHRTRPIYEYPYYPAYNGEGDVNKADSFHPEKMGELHIAGNPVTRGNEQYSRKLELFGTKSC